MRTREGFVIRGSVPLVELDGSKYPWIRLPIQRNPTWIPINLLLGWAFKPNPNANEKHFAIRCKKFVAGVYTGTDGIWHTEPDTDSTLYLKFIDQLYNTN